jgi:hypothetical protein
MFVRQAGASTGDDVAEEVEGLRFALKKAAWQAKADRFSPFSYILPVFAWIVMALTSSMERVGVHHRIDSCVTGDLYIYAFLNAFFTPVIFSSFHLFRNSFIRPLIHLFSHSLILSFIQSFHCHFFYYPLCSMLRYSIYILIRSLTR